MTGMMRTGLRRAWIAGAATALAMGLAVAPAHADPDYVDLYTECSAANTLLESHVAMLEVQQQIADKTIRQLGRHLKRRDDRVKELWAMVHEARKR